MTDSRESPSQESSSQADTRGCLSALLFVVGLILLVPGACAALFVTVAVGDRDQHVKLNDPGLILLWLVCFAISLGGAALIWHVLRRALGRRRS